ncbi:hypothetical protein PR048_017367 [Dryococelus australis]|uniref:Uncharacterized protein n=1 Tax=Dryococelus australis TaxID=614101 RepID=A0ABQ9H9B0_9NEOP|nr:hypothetical protein PR048_017367 [Dryococelus australis]
MFSCLKLAISKTFQEIVEVLSCHFSPYRMVIAERYKFHKHDKQPTESVSQYILELTCAILAISLTMRCVIAWCAVYPNMHDCTQHGACRISNKTSAANYTVNSEQTVTQAADKGER